MISGFQIWPPGWKLGPGDNFNLGTESSIYNTVCTRWTLSLRACSAPWPSSLSVLRDGWVESCHASQIPSPHRGASLSSSGGLILQALICGRKQSLRKSLEREKRFPWGHILWNTTVQLFKSRVCSFSYVFMYFRWNIEVSQVLHSQRWALHTLNMLPSFVCG